MRHTTQLLTRHPAAWEHTVIHTPIIPDPDITVAVEAFRPAVIEIRARSVKLVGLREGSAERRVEQAAIDSLADDMRCRAERIGITLDELFRIINEDLRLNPPEQAHRPTGAHLRVIEAEVIRATAAERRAHEVLSIAQDRVRRATAERIAAQRACAGFAADLAA